MRDLLVARGHALARRPARTVLQAIETGELRADTDPAQLVSEINGLIMSLLHDARFLRDTRAADRARLTWQRLARQLPGLDSMPAATSPFVRSIFRTTVR